MKEKNQIFFIHGGMTFKNRRDYLHFLKTREISIEKKRKWKNEYLDEKLGNDFEIMPLPDFAKYEDWKIHFERHFDFLRDDMILIGSSLGGIFLAKYLSENKFPKKIKAVFLVAPPYDNSLTGEDLVGGFRLRSNLSLLEKNSENLFLMFSVDDDVVPISHAEKYRNKLKKAKILIYEGKNGHFRVSEFPEIVSIIKNLSNN